VLSEQDLASLADAIVARLVTQLHEERCLLDRSTLAARLGISERGVSALSSRGELPRGFLIGGVRRWDWDDVRQFLKSRENRTRRRGRGLYDRKAIST
jgi:predicted DNA-binding transcriptional regulator AlpA